MRLVPVAAPGVSHVWPLVVGFIDRACRKGPLEADASDLKAACERGANQLWVVVDDATPCAAFVTGISDGVCIWLAIGGKDLSAWQELGALVENWAKEQGCSKMRSFARLGWKNKVPDYRMTGFIFEKVL